MTRAGFLDPSTFFIQLSQRKSHRLAHRFRFIMLYSQLLNREDSEEGKGFLCEEPELPDDDSSLQPSRRKLLSWTHARPLLLHGLIISLYTLILVQISIKARDSARHGPGSV